MSDQCNSQCCRSCCDKARFAAYAIGIIGALCLVGWMTWYVAAKTRPPGVDLARADLRKKNLVEVRGVDKVALESYDWVDKSKGIVRLPIQRSLELSLQWGQDPAAAKSNLVARVEKANAKAPAVPNQYE